MYTVGVIYESGEEGDLQVIDLVKEILKARENLVLRERRGDRASIVDINASEVVIFASDGNGRHGINDKFKEIIRALKGVNLAGRVLGVISFDGEETVKAIEEAFKDSCIISFKPSLVYKEGNQISGGEVRDWVMKLLSNYEELVNDRE